MSETTEGVNVELDELRDRLERRNLLLDVVRKAYHRDVFVIRDCLLRMRNGEPLESVLLSTSDLSSVSSIDLRDDPGFFLFSPHECELKLKPCHYCGGRFEVVHHESSRIMSLQAELECSQLKLCQLGLVVNEQLSTINKMQDMTKILSSRLHENENKLQYERYRYKQLLSECVNYKKDAHKVTQWLEDYEKVKLSLDDCSRELKTSNERANFISQELTSLQIMTERLKNDYQLEIRQNEELRRRCVSLEQALSSNHTEKAILEERLLLMEKDLLSLNCSHGEQTTYLRALEIHEIDLKRTIDLLNGEKQQLNEAARETETRCNQQIRDLQQELVESSFASDLRFSLIEEAFKKYKEEQSQKLSSLEGQVQFLQNINSSYIRLVYDRCLLFLKVLLENGCDMIYAKTLKDRGNNACVYLNDCLSKNLDSDRLDWSTLLSNDCDRRQIFGNMSNRLISDSNELIKLVHTLHDKRRVENNNLRREYEVKMNRDLELYHEKITALEIQIEKNGNELSMRESLCSMALCDAESTRMELKCMNGELSSSRETINVAKKRLVDDDIILDHLRRELEQEKEQRQQLQVQVENLQKDVIAYKTSIDDLEKLLGRTSSRFAQLLAKDKERLDTNVSRCVQVSPPKSDFGQQADFILQQLITNNQSTPFQQPHHFSDPSHQHPRLYRSNVGR